jgi:methyl-accepting chemotaxis protein
MNKEKPTRYDRKLRNYLINPPHQLKLVFLTAVTGVLMVIANAVIFFVFIREHFATLLDLIPTNGLLQFQLYSELRHIVLTMILISFVWITLLCLYAIVMSHRAAGALYRFKAVFDEIRAGKRESRIKLRPKDDFQEVAKSFNAMMETLLGGSEGSDSK